MQYNSMQTHQVALHSSLDKKETYKNKIKYVLTRSLFSANLLSLIDVPLTASTLPPFFVLRVIFVGFCSRSRGVSLKA